MSFICIICEEEFDDDEMSEEHNICWNCYEEDNITTLVALEII